MPSAGLPPRTSTAGTSTVKTWTMTTKVAIGVFGAILFLVLGAVLANYVDTAGWGIWGMGEPATQTPIFSEVSSEGPVGFLGGLLQGVFDVVLKKGDATVWTWEMLIIRLAIFMILLFAIADILTIFSTFNEQTSYIISFGLALIAGATGAVNQISFAMGVTAAMSGWAIFFIIMGALGAAVTLNLGIGGIFRKWRFMRWAEVEAVKTAKGTEQVKGAIGSLKEIQQELAR